jgi:hypothetical protein
MSKVEDFDRVGNLLGDFCEAAASVAPPRRSIRGHEPDAPAETVSGARGGEQQRGNTGRVLAAVWAEVAGADVAANARPAQLKGGRLVVSVSSSVWAHTLQYMGDDLIARLNGRLGPGVVQQIVFRHAGWEERSRRHPGDPSPIEHTELRTLSEEQAKAIAQVEGLDLPPEIRDSIARAMKASFVRGEQDSVR